MKRALVLGALLAWAPLALALLVSGSEWLGRDLPGGLPLGNVLSASILCAPALAGWLASRPRTRQRLWAAMTLVAALAWLPVSIWLAGNAALNFHGQRGAVWLGFSAVVVIALGVSLAWALVAALRRRG
ncbi:hypothetical protein [Stenotrophomonas sp. HITSZ_GD]|uniref:hypothetical protein n=1 Tax=Stenotrophomonas sp. HITSZ_GD TaxID=3037248 RepID=UPI00240D7A48|nr:hypothetical protein [Stenotrophomonas sp. HITSZ_GD]